MKLKTLKDLIFSGGTSKAEDLVLKSQIKKEVIKILKADTKDLCEFLGVGELEEKELRVIDLIIKKFNNITEEDLK